MQMQSPRGRPFEPYYAALAGILWTIRDHNEQRAGKQMYSERARDALAEVRYVGRTDWVRYVGRTD